ncbi:MAG: hypothetical protein AABX51_05445 [Nanoarchaeota archaeon]
MRWSMFYISILIFILLFSVHSSIAASGPTRTYCGDGTCQTNENCQGCVQDCGTCPVDTSNITPFGQQQKEEAKKEQCGGFEAMRDRISCRLQLPESAGPLPYTPEECRAVFGVVRANCIKRYDLVQTCWQYSADSERVGCARGLLQAVNITSQLSSCTNKECKDSVAERVFTLTKFRLYNLEEKAEDWLEKGAEKNTVIDFVMFIESKKIVFNNEKNLSEKKQILREVQEEWQNFIRTVSKQVAK